MDESLQDLENELMRLRPRAPSDELLTRLEAGLAIRGVPAERGVCSVGADSNPWAGSWLNWRTPAMAAAAVVTIATAVLVFRQPTERDDSRAMLDRAAARDEAPVPAEGSFPAQEIESVTLLDRNRYIPVGATRVLYDLQDDGSAASTTNRPGRRLRYRYVDTYIWRNPSTNASLKWSLPRDEVRVIPASLR